MPKKHSTPQEVNDVIGVVQVINEVVENGEVNFDIDAYVKGFEIGYNSFGKYGGAFSPYQQNALMRGLNYNPLRPTLEKIEDALNNAANNEEKLISYGQSFESSNMVYKRNVDYLANLNNYDLSIQCINATKSDYTSKKFKKDDEEVKKFLDNFDYRTEFRKAVGHMINNETYYCIFRDDIDENKYILQDFPYQYSKITGRSSHGLLYDIDYSYFMSSAVDINLFPAIVKKKYNEVFSNKKQKPYIPSNTTANRDGVFSMWKQTSQLEGFWAFKFNPDNPVQIPYLAPLFADMVLVPIFRQLQVDQSMAAAKKILASQYPLLKDQKANVKNMLAVDTTIMGQMVGAASRGINNAVKLVNLPSDGFKQIEYENTAPDDYKVFTEQISKLMGGGNVLFQSTKSTIFETQLSLNIDCNLMNSVYPQFEEFLNYQINKRTKTFKFKCKLSGSNTFFDKENKKKLVTETSAMGFVSINKWANALDMNRYELERELEMTDSMELVSKLILLPNAYTQSKTPSNTSTKDAGRPQAENTTELTQSGAETRAAGSNLDRGGSV